MKKVLFLFMCLFATIMAQAAGKTVVPTVGNCYLEEISATECNIHVLGTIETTAVSTIRATMISISVKPADRTPVGVVLIIAVTCSCCNPCRWESASADPWRRRRC